MSYPFVVISKPVTYAMQLSRFNVFNIFVFFFLFAGVKKVIHAIVPLKVLGKEVASFYWLNIFITSPESVRMPLIKNVKVH